MVSEKAHQVDSMQVPPTEAAELLRAGYTYLDVR
jgi:hypothetical protein